MYAFVIGHFLSLPAGPERAAVPFDTVMGRDPAQVLRPMKSEASSLISDSDDEMERMDETGPVTSTDRTPPGETSGQHMASTDDEYEKVRRCSMPVPVYRQVARQTSGVSSDGEGGGGESEEEGEGDFRVQQSVASLTLRGRYGGALPRRRVVYHHDDGITESSGPSLPGTPGSPPLNHRTTVLCSGAVLGDHADAVELRALMLGLQRDMLQKFPDARQSAPR